MIKKLKLWTVQMLTGANIATIVVMLLVGFSYRLHPAEHPMLSTLGMTFPFFLVVNMTFLVFWLIFKWTRAWVPVAGFLLAYVPISIYLPFNMPSAEPEGTIKLVSYNVCAYGGNYKYENGLQKVIDFLEIESPDIVCIQEDTDDRHRNIMKEYGKLYAYNDTVVLVKNKKAHNGLGIHTRFPILRRERIWYSTELSNGSMAWWLQAGSDTLIVVNNHFESCHLSQDDRKQYKQMLKGRMDGDSVRAESKLLMVKLAEANAKRSRQIDEVCRYVDAHRDYPIIVCGDFNDNPLSYSCYAMSKRLTDCFAAVGRGVGVSYNQKGFFFRIDHVFCSDSLQPVSCKIDSKMDASDHYPVVCTIKIGGKP